MSKRIAIIGAGINGVALALRLKKKGIIANIYERSMRPRVDGTGIYIWPQGMSVLRNLVGDDKLKPTYQKIDAINTLDHSGRLIHGQSLAGNNTPFSGHAYMFHRRRLYEAMLDQLDPKQLHFGKKALSIKQKDKYVVMQFSCGKMAVSDALVGADGLYSTVRESLFPGWEPKKSGVSVSRGICNFDLGGPHDYTCDIFAGPHARIVTYPTKNSLRERYWFAAYQNHINNPHYDRASLLSRFSKYNHRLLRMIEETEMEDQIDSSLADLTTNKTWHKGRAVLIGDAAHAILPTIGYGLSLGLENVFTLGNMLIENTDDPQSAFREYEGRCLIRTREMSELSREFTDLFYHQQYDSLPRDYLSKLYVRFLHIISSSPYENTGYSTYMDCQDYGGPHCQDSNPLVLR